MLVLRCVVFVSIVWFAKGRRKLDIKDIGINEFDRCILSDGSEGECRYDGNCVDAERKIKERITPEICRFTPDSNTLYCCPNEPTGGFRMGQLKDFFSSDYGHLSGPNLQCNYRGDIPYHCCNNKVIDVKEKCEDSRCPELPRYDFKQHNNISDLIIAKCLKYQQYINVCTEVPGNIGVMTRMNVCVRPDVNEDLSTRIVNGEDVADAEFPHLAILGHRVKNTNNNVKWVGGGSLISEKFILTAAHVLIYENELVSYAWLGVVDIRNTDDGVLYVIIRAIPHKYYSSKKETHHDIALLELDRKVLFSSVGNFIRPICLPFPGIQFTKERIIAGWGSTRNNAPGENVALQANVQILDYERDCKREIDSDLQWNPETMICALGKNNQDTCKGDSGGPLMANALNINCTYILEGIVVSGNSCGKTPGVYLRVEPYLDWIVKIVWPHGKASDNCI